MWHAVISEQSVVLHFPPAGLTPNLFLHFPVLHFPPSDIRGLLVLHFLTIVLFWSFLFRSCIFSPPSLMLLFLQLILTCRLVKSVLLNILNCFAAFCLIFVSFIGNGQSKNDISLYNISGHFKVRKTTCHFENLYFTKKTEFSFYSSQPMTGVSNLFDRRAKGTNFKLVGARLKCWRRRGGKGMGRGCPPPQPTRGSVECRKLSQWGPGQSPGRKRVLAYFRAWKHTPDRNKSIIFDISGRPHGLDRNACWTLLAYDTNYFHSSPANHVPRK